MFKKQFIVKLLSFLVVISIFSLVPIVQKIVMDVGNNKVELTYSYEGVEKLSVHSSVKKDEVLRLLKAAGITSIIINEENLRALVNSGEATLIKGSDLINISRIIPRANNLIYARFPANTAINPSHLYVVADDPISFELIKLGLEMRLGGKIVSDLGSNLLEIAAEQEQILDTPLNVNINKAKLVADSDLKIIPALYNDPLFTEDQILFKDSHLKAFEFSTVIFTGEEVLGYPDFLDVFGKKLLENNKNYAFIELSKKPTGLKSIARRMPDNGLKVHSIDIIKNDEDKYVSQAKRAVMERNCRIININPYTGGDIYNVLNSNLKFIKLLKVSLQDKGFVVSNISQNPYTSFYFSFLSYASYLAVLVLGWLFLKIYKKKLGINILFMGFIGYALCILGAIFLHKLNLINEISSLILAIVSPVIGFVYLAKYLEQNISAKNKVIHLLGVVLTIFVMSVLLSMIMQNLIFEPAYFWGIAVFKGVKLALVSPLILLAIYLYIKPDRFLCSFFVLKTLVNKYITYKVLLLLAILALILLMYIMRSGNNGILIGGEGELRLRQLLENIFLVRPRTKEIIFAYPLLLILVYYWKDLNIASRNILLIFACLVPVSIINTFSHVHTPFYISLYRSFIGMVLGSILGLIIIVFNNFLKRKKRENIANV